MATIRRNGPRKARPPTCCASAHTRRAELWQELERQAGAPHMLGERFSALDLYGRDDALASGAGLV